MIEKFGIEIILPFVNSTDNSLTLVPAQPYSNGTKKQSAICLIDSQNYDHPAKAEVVESDVTDKALALPSFDLAIVGIVDGVPEIYKDYARTYVRKARAPRTYQRYRSAWNKTLHYLAPTDCVPIPMSAGTYMGVIAAIAASGASLSDCAAVKNAISYLHNHLGLPNPTKDYHSANVWSGIQRSLGKQSLHAKIAIVRSELGQMRRAALQSGDLYAACCLTVAFEGALRNEDHETIDVEKIQIGHSRATLWISRSKTDQFGDQQSVNLEQRPGADYNVLDDLRTLIAGRRKGKLFENPISGRLPSYRFFLREVKKFAACIGIDPIEVGTHSLRAGWVTSEIDLGEKSPGSIASQVRHNDLATLLRYYRPRRTRINLVRHAQVGLG